MTNICVSKLTIIGSDNDLSPDRRQAIIWTNAGLLLIGPLGTNFSEIVIEILTFSFKKMCLKVSSAKRRPFCLGLNVLTSGWLQCYPWTMFYQCPRIIDTTESATAIYTRGYVIKVKDTRVSLTRAKARLYVTRGFISSTLSVRKLKKNITDTRTAFLTMSTNALSFPLVFQI